MTTVVVFHSALGLRPAVRRLAARLRTVGHDVEVPDLFDGAVFDDLTAGEAHRDAIGVPALLERAGAAVAPLEDGFATLGLSMGTAPAALLAATRPAARGAVLLHGALPLGALGLASWPTSVPVQVHVTEADPWVDPAGIAGFLAAVPPDLLEHHVYPGTAHLFTDEDAGEYVRDAAEQAAARIETFLATADRREAAGAGG